MSEVLSDLQSAFVTSMGQPIPFGDEQIVQGDRWSLDKPAVLEIRFIGDTVFEGQSVRLSIAKPGRIQLSDGTYERVVAIQDEQSLPRFARHLIEPKGVELLVSNSYQVERGGIVHQESWTGNAGLIVTQTSVTSRRYECSNGVGAFDRTDLVFDVTVLAADTPWLPHEIYA